MTKLMIQAALVAFTTAALVHPQGADADEKAEFVVQKAYDAALGGEMEVALDMLTEDVFFTVIPAPGHPIWAGRPYLKGREAVGSWWDFLASDNSRLKIVDLTVEGDRAMFSFEFSGDNFKPMGDDPAMFHGFTLLRDGKVGALILAPTTELMRSMAARAN